MNFDKRLLQQAAATRRNLALTVSLEALNGLCLVFQAWILSRVVARAFLESARLAQLEGYLFALAISVLVRAGLAWGSEITAGYVATQVKTELRRRLLVHLIALGPAYVVGERTGELTNTLVEGVEALDDYFRRYLPQVVLAVVVPGIILMVIFPRDWLSGVVLLVTAPLIPFFMVLVGTAADALTRKHWAALSQMSAHFLDVLQGLTTLKLLGHSREWIDSIAEISDCYRSTTMGVLRISFLSALVLELLATLSTAVVAVQVGLRLLYGKLAFESAFAILLLAPEFYIPLRMLGMRFHAGMSGVAAAKRIFEVLEIPLPVQDKGVAVCPLPSHKRAVNLRRHTIALNSVHYAYGSGQHHALRDVSFSISSGEIVALAGPSGAGKSTVVRLLLKFIVPIAGQITVNDIPLAQVPPDAWRSQIAWVPQQPFLFNSSVAENIRLGKPSASLDAVVQAAKLSAAHSFISTLPQGYETIIGERGARLSAGQAQRITLARAFLKDAPFLILDEPSAHLDPAYSVRLHTTITRLMRGRTVLLIAHHLATFTGVHQIITLDKGRVVETWTHNWHNQNGNRLVL